MAQEVIGTKNGQTFFVGSNTPAPAPAKTTTTTTKSSSSGSSGGSSTPSVNYSNLVNVNGTIYNKSTGQGYSTPAQLASYLGIPESSISWNSIVSGPKPVVASPTPTPTPTPTPSPTPTPTSTGTKVSYADLINNNGTIYNTKTGQGYSTPEQLAAALGVSTTAIQWNTIKTGAAPGATPATQPTASVSYSNLVNKNGTIYNSATGKGYATPEELAKDLGISVDQINWNAIRANQGFDPTANQVLPEPNTGMQPVSVPQASPQAAGAGVGATGQSYADVLSSIYNSRADLQQLYNPDGSAKNPNDPRIANIPTLNDWAAQYGVNEHPELQAAGQAAPAVGPDGQPVAADGQLPTTEPAVAEDPVSHVNNIYNQVYEKLGLSSLKASIEDYNKQLLKLRDTKVDDANKINSNPWLSEGIRVREVAKLDEKYDQKEGNLLAYMQMATSLYNTGLSQANAMISDINALEASNKKFDQDLVDSRYKLANGQPFYKYPGTPLVYSTATGQGVSYDQYIQLGGDPGFANVWEIKPQGSTDERTLVLDLIKKYGDAGILPSDSLAVAQEKQKGSLIYQNSVRAITGQGAKTGSSGGSGGSGGGGTGGGGSGGSGGGTSGGITLSNVPKTASDNNIRNWLASNWHKMASRSAYYDVWGVAADQLRKAGIDPAKYDKVFWDVFRPGEYDTYHQKSSSTSSTSSSSSYESIH